MDVTEFEMACRIAGALERQADALEYLTKLGHWFARAYHAANFYPGAQVGIEEPPTIDGEIINAGSSSP